MDVAPTKHANASYATTPVQSLVHHTDIRTVPAFATPARPPLWLLVLALCHGLLYLALIPPWQHYDEPTHFEYARLIAIWDRVPAPGEYDPATRREIADSLYRVQAFYPPGLRPIMIGPEGPNIGIDQRVHPPLYYALAALPIEWLQYTSIETQLYAARLPGIALYVLIVATAWHIGVILEPERRLLRTVLALLVLLTPAFTDMMGAVNNDVLVNFALSSMLLGCVLLVRDGLRPLPLILVFLAFIVGMFAKRTALIGLIPLLLSLFWAIRRESLSWRYWLPVLFGVTISSLLLMFRVSSGQNGPLLEARGWLNWLDTRYLRIDIDATLRSLSDIERSSSVYPVVFNALFSSFWQRFGWGQVRMDMIWERSTLFIVGLAALGLIVAGWRERHHRPLWWKRSVWLFIATVFVGWLIAVLRVHPLPAPEAWVYIPVGRYLHGIIIPTLALMILGISGLLPQRRRIAVALLLAYFLLLDTLAWAVVITRYFYG